MSAKKPVGEVLKQIAEELQQYHFRPGVKKPDVIIRMVSHLLKKLPKHMRHHILVNLLTYGQVRVPADIITAYKVEVEKLGQKIQDILNRAPQSVRPFIEDLLNKLALMGTVYANKEEFLKAVKELLEHYKNIKILTYNAVEQEVEAICREHGLSQSTIKKILQEIKTKVFKGRDFIVVSSDKDLENIENQIVSIIQKYNVPPGVEMVYVPDIVNYVLSHINIRKVQEERNKWPEVIRRVEQMLGGRQWIPKNQAQKLQDIIMRAIEEVFKISAPSLEEIKRELEQKLNIKSIEEEIMKILRQNISISMAVNLAKEISGQTIYEAGEKLLNMLSPDLRDILYDSPYFYSHSNLHLDWLINYVLNAPSSSEAIRFLKAVLEGSVTYSGYEAYYDVPGYGSFLVATSSPSAGTFGPYDAQLIEGIVKAIARSLLEKLQSAETVTTGSSITTISGSQTLKILQAKSLGSAIGLLEKYGIVSPSSTLSFLLRKHSWAFPNSSLHLSWLYENALKNPNFLLAVARGYVEYGGGGKFYYVVPGYGRYLVLEYGYGLDRELINDFKTAIKDLILSILPTVPSALLQYALSRYHGLTANVLRQTVNQLVEKALNVGRVRSHINVKPLLTSLTERERGLMEELYRTVRDIEYFIERNFSHYLSPVYRRMLFMLSLLGY